MEKNTCRLFHILARHPFSTCERELDYYHQKVRAASRLAEGFKKLGHFK